MKKINKVLLFKIGAIGDVLMTTPLIRQLRKEFPFAQIDYLVGKMASKALEGNKNIDRLIVFDQNIFLKKKIIDYFKLIKSIRKEKYDVVFVLDKHLIFNLTAFLFGIPERIGFDRGREGVFLTRKVKYGKLRHERLYYLDLAHAFGLKVDYSDTDLDIFIPESDKKFADEFFKKHNLSDVICVIPGGAKNPAVGVDDIRRWPLDNFVSLVKQIKKPVILCGGVDDSKINDYVVKKSGKKNIWNMANPSIKKSAALMAKCSKIVCNDSGPMHIASAVNKHIISLFGPSNPARKAPLNKEAVSIWHDDDIYEDDYEIYGKKPKNKEFMRRIKVEEVLEYC